MIEDILLNVVQPAAGHGLRRQMHAELGLVPGPLQEDDQAAGDIKRHVAAKIFLDQRESEIDRGA